MKSHFRAKSEAIAPVNMRMNIFKRMFNLAFKEWRWFNSNPLSPLRCLPGKIKRDSLLTYEEKNRILSRSPHWLKQIILFALNTGLRLSELLSLTWGNIDLSGRILTFTKTKNGQPRTIPLNQIVLNILTEKRRGFSLRDRIFPHQKRVVQFTFRKSFFRAGLKDVCFLDMRHSFASKVVQKGIDLYRIQKLLGNTSPVMTQRYAHLNPDSLKNAIGQSSHKKVTIQYLVGYLEKN